MIEPRVMLLIASAAIGYAPPTAVEPHKAKSVEELVKRLDADAERRHFFDSGKANNDFEAVLLEIIKFGRKAENPLRAKLQQDAVMLAEARKRIEKFQLTRELVFPDGYWTERKEIDRLSNNLELLTALRRVQKQPDPLFIRVTPPNVLKAIPGKLPTFSVRLESVDIEKSPIWIQLIPHFHGSRREAQWRFEVKTPAGDIQPIRPNTDRFRTSGGIKSDGWLKSGEYLDTVLPMGDFIDIPIPGDYEVTVMYHPKLPIADISNSDELRELIVFRSPSFKLTVEKGPKFVIESSSTDNSNVLSLVNALPNTGLVKIVGGVYDEDDYSFVSPASPAGKILTLNWRAVPALLDALLDETVSRHQKAWVLSILFSITAQHELNPIHSVGALPDYDGRAGKNTLGADRSGNSRIVEDKQQSLIAKWLVFREQYLDIRESRDK